MLQNEMEAMQESTLATEIADRVVRILTAGMQYPKFGKGSPTTQEVAQLVGRDPTWVREGIEKGWFPIGICTTNSSGHRNFYISPKMLWEVTGIVWEGRSE